MFNDREADILNRLNKLKESQQQETELSSQEVAPSITESSATPPKVEASLSPEQERTPSTEETQQSIQPQVASQLESTETTPQESPEVLKFKELLKRYEDKINAPKKEYGWQEHLPDALAAAHNILNYGQGSRQANLNLGYLDKKKQSDKEARNEELSGIQNLQNMYQKYMAMTAKEQPTALDAANLELIKAKTEHYGKPKELSELDQARIKTETARAKSLEVQEQERERKLLEKQRADQELGDLSDRTVTKIDNLKDAIKKGGVTGWFDNYFIGTKDKLAGDPKENVRKGLLDVAVDQTLLKTALTKGAISDQEMALFKSGVPTLNDQESVWTKWLDDVKDVHQKIKKRLDLPDSKGAVSNFSEKDEQGIKRVMDFNNISREEAIAELKKAKKL